MILTADQCRAEVDALEGELESFSYSISHDLRAPVRAVIGFARALEDEYEGQLDAEGRRILRIITREALRVNELIDGLLALSRLGRQAMQIAPVDMTTLVREVALEQAESAGPNGVMPEIPTLPSVTGDRPMLRQVWAHLLSNATKFSSRRASPQLEIHASLETSRAVFHVHDNGVGFDMKYAGQLFGVFQRLHAADDFPGSGIGLAMVKRIVHRHGGTVWADARLDEGSTFSFALPAGNSA